MTKKPDLTDYFSPEAREARRQARLQKTAGISGAFRDSFATKYAGRDERLTTQNAGLMAVAMARELFDNYRLPTQPKLSYSGLRNGKTARNSSKLQDGVITVHASFRTFSNVVVDLDVPFEIHEGKLLEPSVVIHNGAPRIIAQSTFDHIVENNTAFDTLPVREMYSQPLDHHTAKEQYSQRTKVPRVDRGMFSVNANQEILKAAMQGRVITAQLQPGPDQMVQPAQGCNCNSTLCDHHGKDGFCFNQADSVKMTDVGSICDECAANIPKQYLLPPHGTARTAEWEKPWEQKDEDAVEAAAEDETNEKEAQLNPPPAQQPLPGAKNDSYGHPILQSIPRLKNPEKYNTSAPYGWGHTPRTQDEMANTPPPGMDNNEPTGTVPPPQQEVPPNAVVPEWGPQTNHGTGFEQTRMRQPLGASKNPKNPKSPKTPKQPKNPKMPTGPKLKSKPDAHRLCAKCNHAPCICKNKRKKKAVEIVKAEIARLQAMVKTAQGGSLSEIKTLISQLQQKIDQFEKSQGSGGAAKSPAAPGGAKSPAAPGAAPADPASAAPGGDPSTEGFPSADEQSPAAAMTDKVMEAVSAHPYYEQKYGQFFGNLQSILQKPIKEQYPFISQIQSVLGEMAKDKNSARLYKQVKGPLEKVMKNMVPQKGMMTKVKDLFRPNEPAPGTMPSKQWTPGGLQSTKPGGFNTRGNIYRPIKAQTDMTQQQPSAPVQQPGAQPQGAGGLPSIEEMRQDLKTVPGAQLAELAMMLPKWMGGGQLTDQEVTQLYQKRHKLAQLTNDGLVSKVSAEVDDMRSQGLQEIDIKQSVFHKYGPDIAASIFK
jgi:hypothetical protein